MRISAEIILWSLWLSVWKFVRSCPRLQASARFGPGSCRKGPRLSALSVRWYGWPTPTSGILCLFQGIFTWHSIHVYAIRSRCSFPCRHWRWIKCKDQFCHCPSGHCQLVARRLWRSLRRIRSRGFHECSLWASRLPDSRQIWLSLVSCGSMMMEHLALYFPQWSSKQVCL